MTESLRILLNRLIDYAGLFPPAKLSLPASTDHFRTARAGEDAWMLNRFALPAARLSEFSALLEESQDGFEWELSAIAGPSVETDIAGVVEFNHHIFKGGARAVVRAIEIRAGDPQAIRGYRALIPASVEAYFEISLSAQTDECIAATADTDSYAKLRAGGETPEMFPSCAEVAHFLAACAFASVPFKCTAGLHHPLRGTYAQAEQNGTGLPPVKMHGFLNLTVAAALAQTGATTSELEAVLAEESATALRLERSGARWRDHFIGNEELAAARSSFCLSIGSCSIAEPLEELRGLGLL